MRFFRLSSTGSRPSSRARVVDQPLDDVRRLRPSRSAIRRRRVGIREDAQHLDVGGGERVDPDERDDIAEGGEEVPVGRDVGADIGERLRPEAEKASVGVERQLRLGDIVARVLVGGDGLAALARPLDGPADLLGGPEHEAVLGVLPALGAEAAADVARDHPDAVLGDLEDIGGERVPHPMGILHVGVERVALLARVPDARARRAAPCTARGRG